MTVNKALFHLLIIYSCSDKSISQLLAAHFSSIRSGCCDIMSRSSSGKRPASANSRNAWNDDGLDAPGGRPDSQQSGEFENRDLTLGDEGEMMPTAMEGEVFVNGEIVVAGQERKHVRPKPVSGFAKFKDGLRCKLLKRIYIYICYDKYYMLPYNRITCT